MKSHLKQLKQRAQQRAQRGFTLVELIVTIGIIALLTILAIPLMRDFIIDGKVAPTASDVTKIVTKMRTNMQGSGVAPYLNLGATGPATGNFSNTARGLATALTVTGTGATATTQHDLGLANSQVSVAQANLGTAGDSFAVTFPTVHKAACPGLAAQLVKTAEVITINGTTVKPNGGTYNGGTAQNVCTAGDTNTFVFTFK